MILLCLTETLPYQTGYQPATAALLFMISGSKKHDEKSFKPTTGLTFAINGCIPKKVFKNYLVLKLKHKRVV